MSTALQIQHSSDTIAILTATSGDTGKAALSGFADVPQTAVTVFYPELGVSEVQKRQMQTSAGRNVSVIAVRGNFDDCQRMVKEACSDPTIRQAARHVMISSANSINIGRLVPQIVYYFKAYADLIKLRAIRPGDPISFCVPTGNFGDILAGYLAKQCGLPIHRLICASNTNHVLADFLQTGIYSINRPFHTTMSPSMDILISSNLERLLYLASDRSSELICRCMAELKEKGEYQIPADLLARIQATFVGGWTSEQECRDTIHDLYQQEHVLIDPHTAVALHAMHAYQKESGDHFPCVVLSTASPYKFSTDVLASISGRQVDDGFAAMTQLQQLTGLPIPANLRRLPDLPIRFHKTISIEEGPDAIRRRIAELSHD